ncbi:YhcH/YjgK/YiaL family protein [Paenibacillus chartarius]|uniref:YhcH/YjgK/YiaL family protein n=1 Tax=Paenibacillus chartarius TaxID=747481 RepID=A0ABV6DR69_9BACL
MIFSDIRLFEEEKHTYPAAVRRGLEYIRSQDFSRMELGKYSIEGDDMFALVQEMNTGPKSERKPESHRKYLDIQYLVSGTEIIGVGKKNEANEVLEDDLANRDIVFYRNLTDETDLLLKPGMFAVFYPTDVHRPGVMAASEERIRKVVIKIAMSLL